MSSNPTQLPNARPLNPAGPAPLRQPGSLRRTSSVDVFFPQGKGGNMRVEGRARDIATLASGAPPIVLAEDRFTAELQPDRIIAAITAEPARPGLARLIGQSGSSWFRARLQEAVPQEKAAGTPLYLILDDMPGATLVSGWAWSQWDPDWLNQARQAQPDSEWSKKIAKREGVCIAHAPGSPALRADSPKDRSGDTAVPDLRNPDDPLGWHEFPIAEGIGFRRARRIDIVLDGMIRVDSAFQDSAASPKGGRVAVHEYRLSAVADPGSFNLCAVHADPRILPYAECPSAIAGLQRLIDVPMPELREKVLMELRGVAGCTHLNDALRALAEVPALLDRFMPVPLPRVLPA